MVLVDEAAEDRLAFSLSFVETHDGRYGRRDGVGMALVQALVRSMSVVMRRVLAKDSPRVARVQESESGRAVRGACPDEALADRIRPRCARWRFDDLDGVGLEYLVEHRGVFRVPIP